MVAAADPVQDQRRAFEAAFPGGRAYASLEDLLASETLDFIDLCTPPGDRLRTITLALEAGVHVLAEKPLAISFAEATAIADAAARTGRIVHTVHNWLAAPACLKVSELIDSGAIGEVRSVRWRTLRTGPAITVGDEAGDNWRLDPRVAGGGILVDHGWHAYYCVQSWIGAAPVLVSATLENRRFRQLAVEDTATVDLEFAQGRTSHVHLSWAADERSNSVEVQGERGLIRIEGPAVLLRTESGERRWERPPALSEGSHHPKRFGLVADAFLRAAAGSAPANLNDALLCAELIDLARASSAAGGSRLPVGATGALAQGMEAMVQ